MAYDLLARGPYSGRPAYNLQLYVRRDATDAANNRATYAWQLSADGPQGQSYVLDGYGWGLNVGGYTWGGAANMDFRNQSSFVIASGVTGWVGHDANGYLNLLVDAIHENVDIFGTAKIGPGYMVADRIVPPTPPVVTPPVTAPPKERTVARKFGGTVGQPPSSHIFMRARRWQGTSWAKVYGRRRTASGTWATLDGTEIG